MLEAVTKDKSGRERRQFIAWVIGSLVMPITAYPMVSKDLSLSDLDFPVALMLGVCWAVSSFLLSRYIKKNVK